MDNIADLTQQQVNQLKKEEAEEIFLEAFDLIDHGTLDAYLSALEKFQQARRIFEEIGEKSKYDGDSLGGMGFISDALGKKEEALRLYKKALTFYQDNEDKHGESSMLSNIGMVYNSLGERQKALEFLNQALPLMRGVGDESGEATILSNIGMLYNNLGEKQKALEFLNQALSMDRQVGDKYGEATTLNNIGSVYDNLGEKQRALEFLNQSLPLMREIGDESGVATTLNNIGMAYSALGEKQKALEYFDQALPLRIQVGDKYGEATTLSNIGIVYDDLGERRKALEFYNQSLLLTREVGDISGEAKTLSNIGSVYDDLGEKRKALGVLNQSLLLMRKTGDKSGEATTLNHIGIIFDSLGEKQKAQEYFDQALPLRKKVGDKMGEATTLSSIGMVYSSLGENKKALEYFNQALLIDRQVGDRYGEAITLNNIGSVYDDLKESEKALGFYNQALPLSRRVGDKTGEATTLNNIGMIYDSLGVGQKALEYLNKSLQLRRQVGDKRGEATTLNNIGIVYDSLGENKKALGFYYQVLPLIRQVGDKGGEAATISNIMYLWGSQKALSLAAFYGKQSVDVFQQLRINIKVLDNEIQKTYLKSVEFASRQLTDLLIKQNRLAEAQQVLNSFKDQQFFDFDKSRIKAPNPLVLTPREKEFVSLYEKTSEKVGKIGSRLEELKRSIGNRQATEDEEVSLQKIEAKLKTASDEYLAVLKRAETEFAENSDEKDIVGTVPDLVQMQNALRDLDAQTGQKATAIYQVVGKDNFSALLITSDSIGSVNVPFKVEELNEKALQLWALLKSDKYDTTKLSTEIYNIVFKPLEAKLPKDTTMIMWSLDGNLRYLPMASLYDGDKFLIERYKHAVFTRADANRMLAEVSDNWTGVGFGSSESATVNVLGNDISFTPIPGVTRELSEIFKSGKKGILTGETYSDKQFSKENFINILKQNRPLVHIASHFSFRPGDEARSFLLLGDETAITLEEMKREQNLFAGVELLTLSACNTAAQQSGANGREIDGFAELAQRLGAGAVMATLWQVSDASTPWLMRKFYAAREGKAGMSKAEALQQAQLGLLGGTAGIELLKYTRIQKTEDIKIEMVSEGISNKRKWNERETMVVSMEKKDVPLYKKDKSKPFAHPYYWSPFVLYGNWK